MFKSQKQKQKRAMSLSCCLNCQLFEEIFCIILMNLLFILLPGYVFYQKTFEKQSARAIMENLGSEPPVVISLSIELQVYSDQLSCKSTSSGRFQSNISKVLQSSCSAKHLSTIDFDMLSKHCCTCESQFLFK